METKDKEYLKIKEAQEVVGYSEQYLRRLCRENKVTHFKKSGRIYISKRSLIAHKSMNGREFDRW